MRIKFIVFLLAFVFAFSAFGCSKSDAVDEVDETVLSGPAEISILCDYFYEDEIRSIASYTKHLYEDIEIEIISLSNKPSEREMQMQQIKSEIVAGEGPDVFILPCEYPGSTVDDEGGSVHLEAFFSDVEEAMANNLFLPLDEYLASAQFYKEEDMVASVVEAGRNDQGQVVVPLLYTYSLFIVDRNKLENPDANLAFQDIESMLNSDEEEFTRTVKGSALFWVSNIFTDIADYSSVELLVGRDTLAANLKNLATRPFVETGVLIDGLPEFEETLLNARMLSAWEKESEQAVPVYIPNESGGITALVTAYAAVNSNTLYPKAAASFVDVMFSESVQLGSVASSGQGYISSINQNLLDYRGISPSRVSVESQAQLDLLDAVNENISSVRFYSMFDTILYDHCHDLYLSVNPNYFTDIADKIYSEWKMELLE